MSKPFQTASGDVLADRRADYAEMMFASGEPAAAAEIMLGALELAPGWALGWFRLGEFYEQSGGISQAVEAWRTAKKIDPADHAGAALKLALAGDASAAESMPSAFVETLFDQYAPTFDAQLVDKLGYRVPALLVAAILAAGADRAPFATAIDLGCGTGLLGELLRPHCARLEGYDLSAEMLRKAEHKAVYDRLHKADLQTLTYAGPPVDLVAAADVFMYVGALDRVVPLARSMLAPSGVFAFSVEKLEGDDGFALRPSRRYAHAETYVRDRLGAHGFTVLSMSEATIRQDRNAPVAGLLFVAARE